jgi:hypothetical protein
MSRRAGLAVVFERRREDTVPALDRTQPSLPMKRGLETTRHDQSVRGDEPGTGEVSTQPRQGLDVLRFFQQIDAAVSRRMSVHVVLDNLSAHTALEVKKWLAHKDRRRWHLRFALASSSWMCLTWAEHLGISDPRPFVWNHHRHPTRPDPPPDQKQTDH